MRGAGVDNFDGLLGVEILAPYLDFLLKLEGELCGQCHGKGNLLLYRVALTRTLTDGRDAPLGNGRLVV